MTAGADLRLVRAAVFTAVCVTLSAAGHSLTGGHSMPLWSLGLGFLLVFAVAAPLAGRERSLPGIAALLAGGQIVLHTLFACGRPNVPTPAPHRAELRELAASLLCGEQAGGRMTDARARQVVEDAGLAHRIPAGHGPGNGGHTAHAAHEAAAGSPLECLRSAADAALSLLDGPMLLGHVLAALVLGWFLHRGEAALWRLVRLSARSARTAVHHVRASFGAALAYVRALLRGLLPVWPPRGGRRESRERGTARSVLLQHSVSRRGPPRAQRQQSFGLAA
jgi:hypothetical protein